MMQSALINKILGNVVGNIHHFLDDHTAILQAVGFLRSPAPKSGKH